MCISLYPLYPPVPSGDGGEKRVRGNKVSTLVLRGATDSSLDDLERAVDDGINSYKVSVPSCQAPRYEVRGSLARLQARK